MRTLVANIRSVEKRYDRPIGILVDLQGPKLRVGEFKSEFVTLKQGASFVLDGDKTPGDATRVPAASGDSRHSSPATNSCWTTARSDW